LFGKEISWHKRHAYATIFEPSLGFRAWNRQRVRFQNKIELPRCTLCF
jgi:hypothetical protein